MSNIFPKYIFTCHNVIHHDDDDTLSYERVFEYLTVESIPIKIHFNLVIGIDYSIPKKGNRKITIRFVGPNDKVSAKDLNIDLSPAVRKQIRFALNIIEVNNFIIYKEGQYSILVMHNGEVITQHEFLVERGVINERSFDDSSTVSNQ